MKFWQLLSIMRDQPQAVREVAGTQESWREYQGLAANWDALVAAQQRDVLDLPVPGDFAEAVLARSSKRLFLGRDGWLRPRRRSWLDRKLTLAAAAAAHGGAAVEDALEYGSVQVAHPRAATRVLASVCLLAAALALGWFGASYLGLL